MENIVEKVKLLILSNFNFSHNVFLKGFILHVLKWVYMEERVTAPQIGKS